MIHTFQIFFDTETWTYIDDYPFAVVVVVWNWMEVVLAGILRILVDSFLLVSTELGQFPEIKIKQFRYLSRFLINKSMINIIYI